MKAALIVLDGWGLGAGDPDGPAAGGRNAVLEADTPAFDRLHDVLLRWSVPFWIPLGHARFFGRR